MSDHRARHRLFQLAIFALGVAVAWPALSAPPASAAGGSDTLWGWGDDRQGQLGVGSSRRVPAARNECCPGSPRCPGATGTPSLPTTRGAPGRGEATMTANSATDPERPQHADVPPGVGWRHVGRGRSGTQPCPDLRRVRSGLRLQRDRQPRDGAICGRQLSPVDVVGLPAGITAISVGRDHSVALDASGVVWTWGQNSTVSSAMARRRQPYADQLGIGRHAAHRPGAGGHDGRPHRRAGRARARVDLGGERVGIRLRRRALLRDARDGAGSREHRGRRRGSQVCRRGRRRGITLDVGLQRLRPVGDGTTVPHQVPAPVDTSSGLRTSWTSARVSTMFLRGRRLESSGAWS